MIWGTSYVFSKTHNYENWSLCQHNTILHSRKFLPKKIRLYTNEVLYCLLQKIPTNDFIQVNSLLTWANCPQTAVQSPRPSPPILNHHITNCTQPDPVSALKDPPSTPWAQTSNPYRCSSLNFSFWHTTKTVKMVVSLLAVSLKTALLTQRLLLMFFWELTVSN